MMHHRARIVLRAFTLMREEAPELYAQIQEFMNSRIANNEVWECCNCWNSGALTIRGTCERCGSEAVSPQRRTN